MLQITNLSKSFSDTKVLDNISHTVDSGKLVALLGKNGSGKTTFLKCISNIMNIDSGDVDYNGSSFLFLNDKANIFSDLTILNNLKCILRFYNQDLDMDTYNKYLNLLGLKEFESLPLKYLSRGNLQRNKLFIALNLSWKYLLIDEPFTNLDDSAQDIFRDIFLDLKSRDRTIIFSTHNFSHVSDICDQSIKIEMGKIAL
jgi:ABC-2 type transport system ATP-binding protein|tara:strand:+ start:697 stop:1296 length:600 start_codon:yes stop_codon:yes gene_type:complete